MESFHNILLLCIHQVALKPDRLFDRVLSNPCYLLVHDFHMRIMQAASNEAADKAERAFLQILLMSLNSNSKEVSVQYHCFGTFQLCDVVGLEIKVNHVYVH